MKVTLRNLIYGLLVIGLPLAVAAGDGTDANARSEGAKTSIEQIAVIESGILGQAELDSVLAALPAHQEVLRERLRAWADAAEAAQVRRNNLKPLTDVVLARN